MMPTTDPTPLFSDASDLRLAVRTLQKLVRDWEDPRNHPDHASGLKIAAAEVRRLLCVLGDLRGADLSGAAEERS